MTPPRRKRYDFAENQCEYVTFYRRRSHDSALQYKYERTDKSEFVSILTEVQRMAKKQSVSTPKLLQRQQQIVRGAIRRDFVGALGILVMIFIVVLCVLLRHEAKNTKLLLLVCLPLFAAALVLLLSGLSHRRLLLQLEQVDSPKGECVSILCKKVKFMLQQSRHASRSYWILCVVLLDEQGECYYYVQSKSLHQSMRKNLRARYLDKELALICYGGTRLVKELPQEILEKNEKVEKNT